MKYQNGTRKVSLVVRCPLFRGVLYKGFHCTCTCVHVCVLMNDTQLIIAIKIIICINYVCNENYVGTIPQQIHKKRKSYGLLLLTMEEKEREGRGKRGRGGEERGERERGKR